MIPKSFKTGKFKELSEIKDYRIVSELGIYWVKLHYTHRNLPTKILACYLCTCNEHFGKSLKELNIEDKNGVLKTESEQMKCSDSTKNNLPEEPTTCCMSGCANCVWLDYAEKMSEHFKDGGERAIKEINERISDPNIKAYLLQELRMKKL